MISAYQARDLARKFHENTFIVKRIFKEVKEASDKGEFFVRLDIFEYELTEHQVKNMSLCLYMYGYKVKYNPDYIVVSWE